MVWKLWGLGHSNVNVRVRPSLNVDTPIPAIKVQPASMSMTPKRLLLSDDLIIIEANDQELGLFLSPKKVQCTCLSSAFSSGEPYHRNPLRNVEVCEVGPKRVVLGGNCTARALHRRAGDILLHLRESTGFIPWLSKQIHRVLRVKHIWPTGSRS